MTPSVHDPRRRLLLCAGSGLLLSSGWPGRSIAAQEVEISMSGTRNGARVWFRPRGLLIQPGQTIRWINHDSGNVHTITAYHPDNGKPLRIPEGARSWDSGYLMPEESFAMAFNIPGVYDYFCIPHEHAGMVGRIVVGEAVSSNPPYGDSDGLLPEAAVAGFPAVAKIRQDVTVD